MYVLKWLGYQTVHQLATGWTSLGLNSCGGEIFCTCPDRLWGPPSLLYSGCWVFPVGKAAGVWCWSPTPSSAKVKERVELYLLLPFWAFVACLRVNFTFTFMYWRGRRFDLLSLIPGMVYLTQYTFCKRCVCVSRIDVFFFKCLFSTCYSNVIFYM